MDLDFRCPVCQEPMSIVRNGDVVKALQKRIAEIAPHFPQVPA
jgi:transcription initiation factor IIE alpha subunit